MKKHKKSFQNKLDNQYDNVQLSQLIIKLSNESLINYKYNITDSLLYENCQLHTKSKLKSKL